MRICAFYLASMFVACVATCFVCDRLWQVEAVNLGHAEVVSGRWNWKEFPTIPEAEKRASAELFYHQKIVNSSKAPDAEPAL